MSAGLDPADWRAVVVFEERGQRAATVAISDIAKIAEWRPYSVPATSLCENRIHGSSRELTDPYAHKKQ